MNTYTIRVKYGDNVEDFHDITVDADTFEVTDSGTMFYTNVHGELASDSQVVFWLPTERVLFIQRNVRWETRAAEENLS